MLTGYDTTTAFGPRCMHELLALSPPKAETASAMGTTER